MFIINYVGVYLFFFYLITKFGFFLHIITKDVCIIIINFLMA